MDFFEHQEAARKRTTLLVVLFIIGLVCTFAATYLLIIGAIDGALFIQGYRNAAEHGGSPPDIQFWDPVIMLVAAGATILIIGGGTLYKINELAGGGAVIAAHLGGRIVQRGTTDFAEKRLLNVVEEMAIASGTPVPPVYVMDRETGINAFAGGRTPGDAVIGVTRGAIETMSRDELQGVIAHEFSHILNGDMRLNLRLIGILHGILVLSLIGQFLLRASFYTPRSRSDRGNAVLYMLALGVGLVIIGAVGSLFGNLIKSAVSRQREYLADASAVQFTRNPGGIAGALKKILGLAAGSRVRSPHAPEASHMFFGQATTAGFSGLFSTHPPLRKRIFRIEPRWDGKVEKVSPVQAKEREPDARRDEDRMRARAMTVLAGATIAAEADQRAGAPRRPVLQRIGFIEHEDVAHAQLMLERVPTPVRQAAEDPFSAQCIVFALLIDPDAVVAETQFAGIAEQGAQGLERVARALLDPVRSAGQDLRLAMIDLSLPSLRQLSRPQYETFRTIVGRLVAADRRISLFEWCVQRIVVGLLDEHFGLATPPGVKYYALKGLSGQVRTVLSALARVGQSDEAGRARAFAAGATVLSDIPLDGLGPGLLTELAGAVDELATVAPRHKKRVIEACAAVLSADGVAKPAEVELFRAFAQALGVPIPPLLPGTTLM